MKFQLIISQWRRDAHAVHFLQPSLCVSLTPSSGSASSTAANVPPELLHTHTNTHTSTHLHISETSVPYYETKRMTHCLFLTGLKYTHHLLLTSGREREQKEENEREISFFKNPLFMLRGFGITGKERLIHWSENEHNTWYKKKKKILSINSVGGDQTSSFARTCPPFWLKNHVGLGYMKF